MIRPRSVFFGLLLSFVLVAPLFAQTKIGYLDAAKLLKQMPEAVDAESRMGQLVGQWTHDADEIQNELNRKSAEFERRKLIMTDAERTAFEVELQSLRKKLDDFRQSKYGQNGELFTQQATLMKPAYDRLQKAIEDVARDGNYDYVIDRSAKDVTMLYANAKYDLTLAVARKLNIETDALAQPLLTNSPANGQNPPNGMQPNGTAPNGTPGKVAPQTPPGRPLNPQNTPPTNVPPNGQPGNGQPLQQPPPDGSQTPIH